MKIDYKKIFIGAITAAITLSLILTVNFLKSPDVNKTNFNSKAATSSLCQKMVIPAYFYPSASWDPIYAAASAVGFLIVNPASGPGTAVDPTYVNYINRARSAGIPLLGYVDTTYASIPLATVKSHIDTWKTLYQINDIFVDQTSSGSDKLAYFQEISNHVRATAGSKLMFNPGVAPAEAYMNLADQIMIFEGDSNMYKAWNNPLWTSKYDPSRFVHLIHTIPDVALMNEMLTLSRERRAGYVFINSAVMPNAWDRLPPYWDAQTTALKSGCTGFKHLGDFNGDNVVNLSDLSILAMNWGKNTTTGDANGDNIVNLSDLSILASNWLKNLAIPTSAPTTIATSTPTSTPTRIPSPSPTSTSNIWRPTADKPLRLHWQLSTDFDINRDLPPAADVVDIDGEYTSKATVDALHAKGLKVICYIDAGVYEDYRPDAYKFPPSVIGKTDVGWDGSYWLDIRQIDILKPIMEARIKDWCAAKGFDAVEPDEITNYSNDSGFPLTYQDQMKYNIMISELIHKYGMSAGLKGDQEQAKDLEPYFEWNLTEECYQYKECNLITAFPQANKATWIVEYAVNPNCTDANSKKMNAMRRDLNLVGPKDNGYRYSPCIPDGTTSWP